MELISQFLPLEYRQNDTWQPLHSIRSYSLNFWHYAVHTPIQTPPDLVAKYEEKARKLELDEVDPPEPDPRRTTCHRAYVRLFHAKNRNPTSPP